MGRRVLFRTALVIGSFILSTVSAAPSQEQPSQPTDTSIAPAIHAFGFQVLSPADEKTRAAVGKIAFTIRQKWFADPRLQEKRVDREPAIVEFTVDRHGNAENAELRGSSGDTILDDAAVSAIKDSSPFSTVLPARFKATKLRMTFTYTLPPTPNRPSCEPFHTRSYKKPGKTVTAPKALYQPDPEFSEEARKKKYQGTMLLGVTVEPDGTATEICVAQGLGMGLDEKAIAVVKNWKFEPARENGQPVPTRISVEVDFRLY
jgi:TonB family protein